MNQISQVMHSRISPADPNHSGSECVGHWQPIGIKGTICVFVARYRHTGGTKLNMRAAQSVQVHLIIRIIIKSIRIIVSIVLITIIIITVIIAITITTIITIITIIIATTILIIVIIIIIIYYDYYFHYYYCTRSTRITWFPPRSPQDNPISFESEWKASGSSR